jgi:hypothetical protein
MKTERFAMAYRLVLRLRLCPSESEQNSSHLQIDCDRRRWQSSSYTLTIRREKQANDEEKTGDVLYKGVA